MLTKNAVRNFATYLDFQVILPEDKTILTIIPGSPWESIRADIFTINNKDYLCIVDYHCKFLVIN